jgi:hypothetical protein
VERRWHIKVVHRRQPFTRVALLVSQQRSCGGHNGTFVLARDLCVARLTETGRQAMSEL